MADENNNEQPIAAAAPQGADAAPVSAPSGGGYQGGGQGNRGGGNRGGQGGGPRR